MAPDEDKLRHRNATLRVTVDDIDVNSDDLHNDSDGESTVPNRLIILSSLQGHEVCIDGLVYDLSSFHHPGGDSIFLFGGNDVSTQYRMIHAHHKPGPNQHLAKMRVVGKVADYQAEYKWDTEFEREIKREVFQMVRRGNEFGTWGWHVRATVYIALFVYLQVTWIQSTSFASAVAYGVVMALIGLNVQHDANHGAASRKVWVNDVLGLGADLIGGSKWLWMEKHWIHHTYTNHPEKDPDGFAAEPLLLFNDYPLKDSRRAFYHPYQAFYLVVLLSAYWASSAFDLPMVWSLQDGGAVKVGVQLDNEWIDSRRKYAIALRAIYLWCNIVLPLYNDFSWRTVGHIYVMGVAGSLTLGCLFTLSHNFEGSDRDPTKEARETGQPVDWFKAQVETSSTYGGTLAGWLTGGLNFQVEHHLFPRMSSAWYPVIAPKVQEVCKKHGVRYAYYPTVWHNMWSTLKYTHEIGNGSTQKCKTKTS